MSPILLAVIAGVVIIIGYVTLSNYAMRKERVQRRLERFNAAAEGAGEGGVLTLEEEKTSGAAMAEGLLSGLGFNLDAYKREMQLKLYQAGIMSDNGFLYYTFAKRIAVPAVGIILGLLCFLAGSARNVDYLLQPVYYAAALFFFVAAFKGVDIYVENLRQKRRKILERSFPDALDLLLVCVESGLALDGALARVCRELGRAHPEITAELNRTRLELTLLSDRAQALQNLADRTDLVAFRSLVSALLQSEKFGTSLADTLRVLSEDYRISRLMAAETKAGRIPVLITMPLVGLMLPALFLIIIGPPIIRVVEQGGLFGGG